mgnify:CR=1 FL=1
MLLIALLFALQLSVPTVGVLPALRPANAQANLAPKGLKQSAGLMVNYLYDLARIETSHDRFVEGRVVHSRALSALL